MCGLRRSNYVLRITWSEARNDEENAPLSSSASCRVPAVCIPRGITVVVIVCFILFQMQLLLPSHPEQWRLMLFPHTSFCLPALYLFVYLLLCFVYSQGVHKFVWRSGEDLHDNWWVINTAVARRRVSTSLQGADYEDPHKSTLTMNNYMKMRLRQALDKMRNIRKQLGLRQHTGKVAAVDWSGNGIHIWSQRKCLVATSPWLAPRFAGLALAALALLVWKSTVDFCRNHLKEWK